MTLTCITFDPLVANLAVAGVVTVLVVDEPVELRGRFGIAANDGMIWLPPDEDGPGAYTLATDDAGDYDAIPDGQNRYWLRHGPTWHRLRSECADPDALLAVLFPDKATEWFIGEVHRNAIVGSGVIEDCVPIVDLSASRDALIERRAHIWHDMTRQRLMLWPNPEPPPIWLGLGDQLPYQQFTPGRYALIVSDVKPTTERCPACWGSGEHGQEPCVGCSCSTCEHDGICPPIPVPGKTGAWEWTP